VATTDDWRDIVGVVKDVHADGVEKDAPSIAYWPVFQSKFENDAERVARYVSYAIRTPQAGSQSFMKQVQTVVWSVDPDLPLSDVSTMGELYTKSMARTSFTLVMLGIAGTMALALGILGIYGVIAYAVSQRTREIGIRMALGAKKSELVWMFVRSALVLTGIGTAVGLGAAAALMRLMRTLLFGVSPLDPVTFAAVPVVLVAAAALASYLPARRTAAVDPVEALRAE
jgi:ABC-type antimicrobial peptide transport system permease subunit